MTMIASQQKDQSKDVTKDAFHRGRFFALQPRHSGHRSGLDALLIAAALPKSSSGKIADLGAGVGVAGFAALSHNENLSLIAVERDPVLVDLIHQNINLPENQHLANRVQVIAADITASAQNRREAGLEEESVSHAIMNPPYNPITLRASPDPKKADAYIMGDGGLDAWFRTATSLIRPGGTIALIYRTEQLRDVLACMQGRFGGLEILPIHSRAQEPAKRIIIRGTRGSKAPLALLPGFVVHLADGTFTESARRVFEGTAHLDFGG